jgi:hypothetical protein
MNLDSRGTRSHKIAMFPTLHKLKPAVNCDPAQRKTKEGHSVSTPVWASSLSSIFYQLDDMTHQHM